MKLMGFIRGCGVHRKDMPPEDARGSCVAQVEDPTEYGVVVTDESGGSKTQN